MKKIEQKSITTILYYLFGMIIGGALIMPLLAYFVSDKGDEFYRQYDPFYNSVFMFICGIWIWIISLKRLD